MVSVGLFDKDSRLHYVDVGYVVVDNPQDNLTPTIVKRDHGEPSEKEVMEILNRLNMLKFGEPFYRSDGLWCQKLILNGARYGKPNKQSDNRNGQKEHSGGV